MKRLGDESERERTKDENRKRLIDFDGMSTRMGRQGIAFIVHLYLYLLYHCFLRGFCMLFFLFFVSCWSFFPDIWYQVFLSNTNY